MTPPAPDFRRAQLTVDAVIALRDLGIGDLFKHVHHARAKLTAHLRTAQGVASRSGRFGAGENPRTGERLHALAGMAAATARARGASTLTPSAWLPLIVAVRTGFPPARGWPGFGFYVAVPDTDGMPIIADGGDHARVGRGNTKVGKSESFASRGAGAYRATFDPAPVAWTQFEVALVEATLDLGTLETRLHRRLAELRGVTVVPRTKEWYAGLPRATATREVAAFLDAHHVAFTQREG